MTTTKRKIRLTGVVENAAKVVRAFKFLTWAAGVSLAGTLLVAALVNLCAVGAVAKYMYGEHEQPPAPVEGVILVGAFGASMASIWTAIFMFLHAPRYRTTGKIALVVVVVSLVAVVVVGDIEVDVDLVFQLMDVLASN